ncbi:MAG: CvpA family protein [Candidatus Omnitrophica bacterium]|nr:CvpA family protein [Candidatus Omnitrophota bacterium]
MDTLNTVWQMVTQSEVWKSVFSHLKWIDWMVVFALIYGFFGGLKKGFPRAFLECITVAAALVLTMDFYTQAADLLKPSLDFFSQEMLGVTGFFSVAFGVMLVLRFVFWGVLFLLPNAESSVIESGLAVLFNILSKILLLGLAAQALLIGPWGGLKQVFGSGDSYSGYALVQLTLRLHEWLRGPLTALRAALPL